MQCHAKKSAPDKMKIGSATSDGQFAYFLPEDALSNIVYRYEWSTEEWEKLPPCPYRGSALVVIDGTLTAVGGLNTGKAGTEKLVTLRKNEWVEEHPPMNNARFNATAVVTADGNHTLVIGGHGNDRAVELYLVRHRRWFKLTSLPESLTHPQATICGNQLYVIGEYKDGYSCSLDSLPSATSQCTSRMISWKALPCIPVYRPTVATLCGQLVIVGGQQHMYSVNSIYQLVLGEWVEIGCMSSKKKKCLVVNSPKDKLLIVGGQTGYTVTNTVEECVVVCE